jgi:hypothetical protein
MCLFRNAKVHSKYALPQFVFIILKLLHITSKYGEKLPALGGEKAD